MHRECGDCENCVNAVRTFSVGLIHACILLPDFLLRSKQLTALGCSCFCNKMMRRYFSHHACKQTTSAYSMLYVFQRVANLPLPWAIFKENFTVILRNIYPERGTKLTLYTTSSEVVHLMNKIFQVVVVKVSARPAYFT
jgi:hypothetical protein